MIKLNTTGHTDLCGGYSYSGTVSFSGTTVAEVLQEIREFSQDKQARYLGNGFGNLKSEGCDNWRIAINDSIFLTSWNNEHPDYNGYYDTFPVDRVEVYGGWYCFYNFTIITKTKQEVSNTHVNNTTRRLREPKDNRRLS